MDIYSECMEYFSQRGFRRVLEEVYKKYCSLSRLGGNVYIDNPSIDEEEVLSRFFRKDFSGQGRIKIEIKDFEKKLKETKFEDFEIMDIVEAVLNKKALTQKEAEHREKEERKKLFQGLVDSFNSIIVTDLIEDIIEKPQEYKMIYAKMKDKKKLKKELLSVCKAIINLPQEDKLRLPVFAANITTDPHYFDLSNDAGRLLIKALSFIKKCPYPSNSEERAELLFDSGILIDELSNHAIVNGLLAFQDGLEDKVWSAALAQEQPMVMTLYNLNRIGSIVSPRNYVIAVENPSVFSAIIEYDPKIPCICVNGQPKLAVLIVLRLLDQSGCPIFYSGDLDPEGLLIADKLWRKFDNIRLCCMNIVHYEKSLSSVKLNEKRLKTLDNIEHPGLKVLGEEIRQKGFAGYQEKIIDEILDFILLKCKGV
ncbi:TIGR02679 domain-containing protein [Lutispora sp.]|uniref:TIGR02679 domain-containing protein n=1 Tax=Lutispora sp. TaxID=2828727 RepID=UPI002B206C78|nr:TIGR02679 domain-containing protein [Lutispora sp.]MEA4964115.1 TIGR02679 domain-containing protein [Lutispora sp.]